MAEHNTDISKVALVIHIHYISTAEVISRAIQSSALKDSNTYITLTPSAAESIDEVKKYFPD